jgi:hypothetical protein
MAAFMTPLVARGWEDLPVAAIALITLAVAALLAAVRAVNMARAPMLLADDVGFEIWRGGSRRARIAWRDIVRTWPFVASGSARIWLPGEFEGRDLLTDLVAWSHDNRRAIAASDGSLTRALEARAAGEGLRFDFDWLAATVASSLMGGVFLAFVGMTIADDKPFTQYSLWDTLMTFVGIVLLGGLALLSFLSWANIGRLAIVSTRGLAEHRRGQLAHQLSWDQMTRPEALKRRRDADYLGCNDAGTIAIDGEGLRRSSLLNAVVDHLLVRELERRELTRKLKPEDVRASVSPEV